MFAPAVFNGMNAGVLIVAIIFFSIMVVGVTCFIARAWSRVRTSEDRTALLGMMLQRGMSAADIERVMNSSTGTGDIGDTGPDVGIVTLMKEYEYKGEDIERVLDAARTNGRIDSAALKIVETLVEQGAKVGEIEGILEARRMQPARVAG